jgi:hypothetical protein
MRIGWTANGHQLLATAALCFVAVLPTQAAEPSPEREAVSRVPLSVRVTPGETQVWKRIALGTYKNVNLLREDLDSRDCGAVAAPQVASVAEIGVSVKSPSAPACNLGETAAEIIGRPAFALGKPRTDVDLVVLTPADLGLTGDSVAVAAVYARAELLGFQICPAEVGPQLRLQYRDQPVGEALHIAMQPIARYSGEPTAFTVINGGAGLLLIGSNGTLDLVVPPTRRFVFVRPRPSGRDH